MKNITKQLTFIVPSILTLLAFVVLIFVFILPRTKDLSIQRQKEYIRELVHEKIILLETYNSFIKEGRMSREQAEEQAIALLERSRYGEGEKEYFWVLNRDHEIIMHPYRPELEGSNLAGYQDQQGNYLFQRMVDIVEEEGGGYLTYMWQFHNDPEAIKEKLSYVEVFPDWGWIVGTGIYIKEAYSEIDEITRSMTIASLVVLILIMIFSIYLTRAGIHSRKKQTEILDKLFESENRYKFLIEFMKEGVTVQDEKENFTYVNKSFCSMLEYSEDEIIGKNIYAFLDEDNRQILTQELEKRKKGSDEPYELAMRTKTDGRIVAMISPQPILGRDGSYRGNFAVVSDITARKKVENQLKSSVEEKNALLREVHHRVKNNLQIITSLLNLQYQYRNCTTAEKNVLMDSQNRIRTMADVHEILYQTDHFDKVDMKDLFERIISQLQLLYISEEKQITIEMEVERIALDMDQAIPCALILNELLSNALQYAFSEADPKNTIAIHLFTQDENTTIIEVSDNGMGIPFDLDFENIDSMGLQLVYILSQQLQGSIRNAAAKGGTKLRAEFIRR